MRRQRPSHAHGAGELPPRLGPKHHHRRRRLGTRDCDATVSARDRPGVARHRPRRRPRAPRRAQKRRMVYGPKIVDWYMRKKIEIDPMITHTMPLTDINKAFELMHDGKSIRSVVVY